MTNYIKQYKKYKNKYLKLKVQIGCDREIFDLSHDHNLTENVQDNIEKLANIYGNKFNIKLKDIIVPVKLEKVINETSNISHYVLSYDVCHWTERVLPFKIVFANYYTSELGNETYIGNIHKTDTISGSEMIKLVLEINKVLSVRKTVLNDGTRILCNHKEMDLSLFKLIEKEQTFYMKYGFDFDITGNESFYIKFNNINELKSKVKWLVQNIRKIKIIDLVLEYEKTLDILNEFIKKQDVTNFNILLKEDTHTYYKKDPQNSIQELFVECTEMLNILHLCTFKTPN